VTHPVDVRRELADLVRALDQAADLLARCGEAGPAATAGGARSPLTGAVHSAREAARQVADYLAVSGPARPAPPVPRPRPGQVGRVHDDPGE
jgi:hypothetical protein